MATKFSLNPNPTFKVTVTIPRPGQDDGTVTLTVRHKTRTQMADLEKELKAQAEKAAETGEYSNESSASYLEQVIESWNIDAEFNRESLLMLLENYPRAFDSIATAFTKELYSVREKN
nr:phage tail assembly chaperone [Pantoea sp. 201603H]